MAHQRPPQMTEPASQLRGQHLGLVESSVRAAAGNGYEVGVCVCVCVCVRACVRELMCVCV